MPKSKSKRRRYQPPAKPKPPPSPRWVPILFFVFLGVGFTAMLARYILSSVVGFFDSDWLIYGGLLLVGAAFGVATQWR
jgi:TRAP-type mannitol/chloroaromatic compound transport system permease small subunit